MTNKLEFEVWYKTEYHGSNDFGHKATAKIAWQAATRHQEAALRELCLQVAGAVFAFAAPSREMESTELIAIVDKVLSE